MDINFWCAVNHPQKWGMVPVLLHLAAPHRANLTTTIDLVVHKEQNRASFMRSMETIALTGFPSL
jgi:hypothetical protein